MCTCKKSCLERAAGSSRKSRLMHLPLCVDTGRGNSKLAGGRWSALPSWHVARAVCTYYSTSAVKPVHHAERRARARFCHRRTARPAMSCGESQWHLCAKPAGRRHAETVASGAAAVKQPVAADEGDVRYGAQGADSIHRVARSEGCYWAAAIGGPRTGSDRLRRERRADRGREVGVKKSWGLLSTADSDEGCPPLPRGPHRRR